MQKPTKHKKIKLIALAIAACAVLLVIPVMFVPTSSVQKESKEQDANNRIVQIQDFLTGNVSRVSELTAQLDRLSAENRELQLAIAQKTAENEKLEGRVKEFSNALLAVEVDLDTMVKTEYISLLVERVRNPIIESTEDP
jgi:predicted RNase H-like nuclease (RuvC/YqgF family)